MSLGEGVYIREVVPHILAQVLADRDRLEQGVVLRVAVGRSFGMTVSDFPGLEDSTGIPLGDGGTIQPEKLKSPLGEAGEVPTFVTEVGGGEVVGLEVLWVGAVVGFEEVGILFTFSEGRTRDLNSTDNVYLESAEYQVEDAHAGSKGDDVIDGLAEGLDETPSCHSSQVFSSKYSRRGRRKG